MTDHKHEFDGFAYGESYEYDITDTPLYGSDDSASYIPDDNDDTSFYELDDADAYDADAYDADLDDVDLDDVDSDNADSDNADSDNADSDNADSDNADLDDVDSDGADNCSVKNIIYTTEFPAVSLDDLSEPDVTSLTGIDPGIDEDMKRYNITSIVKIAAVAVSAVVLLIFGTISWFTMNREVENTGLQMTAEGIPFEIRVSGNNTGALTHTQTGVGDSATYTSSEIYGLSPNNSYLKNLVNGVLVSGSSYETDATNGTIKWRLSQAYDSDEDKGFGPDSQGELTFSIIPTQSGEMDPSFKLRLEGYVALDQIENDNGTYHVMQNKILPITSDSNDEQKQSVTYMNGHVLFFSSRTNVGTNADPVYEYSGLLDENNINLSDIVDSSLVTNGKVNATRNTAITATIYWIWPNTFGQMVFAANENNSRTPVGHNSETRSDIQNYILDNTLSIFDETSFDFEPGTSEADKITSIKNMMAVSSGSGDEITYSFSATKVNTGTNLDVLTLAYNSADQKIGTHIDYVLLALSINNQ